MSTPESTQTPDISTAISKIMEHPELISMVASVLEEPKNAENVSDPPEAAPTSAEKIPTPPPDMLASLMPMISKLSSLGKQGDNSSSGIGHEQLLCALKPYLSRSRSEAIDYIIKISKMSSLLKGLK